MSGKVGDNVFRSSGVVKAVAAGRTGTVDWCTTAKTTGFTAATATGYFVNTCGGAITVTLPASPTAGDIMAVKDYAGTWGAACKAVTLARNGSKINGTCGCATLNTEGQSVTMIYVDATKGWQDIHDSEAGVAGASPYNVEYLVVAAGAGGSSGPCYAGGGGGAGGYRTATGFTVSACCAPYTIQVGGGGAGGSGTSGGTVGENSIFSTITSAGGGGGSGTGADSIPTSHGGSGGGAGGGSEGPPDGGPGPGNDPPVSPPQGNAGGAGAVASMNIHSGGGGGANAAGQSNPGPNAGGDGGAGSPTDILGSTPTAPSYGTPGPAPGRYFAGGGAGRGGWNNNVGTAGCGGVGGGGGTPSATSGTANTGGGGGGNRYGTGGAGGSGVVMIKYTTACASGSVSGGTALTCGSDTIRVFTADGTFVP